MENKMESNVLNHREEQAVNKLTALGNTLEKVQLVVGSLLLAFFLAVIFFDVVMRESGRPIVWLQDVARFAFMWTIFFGAAIGLRRGTHYRIEILSHINFLKPIVFICQAVFIIILIFYGYQFALMGLERVAMPSGIPIFYSAISIPLAGIFMLYYLVESIRAWASAKKG